MHPNPTAIGMADDQFQASGNWWESARSARFEAEAPSQSSNFGWQAAADHMGQAHELKPRSSPSSSSTDPNLQMMGLGLSSQPMDWNQPSFLRGDEKLYSGESNNSCSTTQVNRGFCLDEQQFSHSEDNNSVTTSQGTHFNQMDLYGNNSILQGLLAPPPPDHHHHQQMNFGYPSSYGGIGLSSSNDNPLMPPASAWSSSSSKVIPQFLRASSPKQATPHNNHLHFANNAPFWNATSHDPPNVKDVTSTFFPSLQSPFPTPNFDVQSKNICQVRESGGVVKKSGSEAAPKRPRTETPSPLPAFKVRKEKMGDRITALQQLVSPFGKTDTASVLSEAIEYIKFLHEQVTVLSTPYMKSGAPIQHQQSPGKSKEGEGTKQDLRSRGLCLVPVSSTFPVTHETTVDFWTPTFGGTFR